MEDSELKSLIDACNVMSIDRKKELYNKIVDALHPSSINNIKLYYIEDDGSEILFRVYYSSQNFTLDFFG